MKRATVRFEQLLEKSSNCCLILVMVAEVALLVIILLMWKYKGYYLLSKECPVS